MAVGGTMRRALGNLWRMVASASMTASTSNAKSNRTLVSAAMSTSRLPLCLVNDTHRFRHQSCALRIGETICACANFCRNDRSGRSDLFALLSFFRFAHRHRMHWATLSVNGSHWVTSSWSWQLLRVLRMMERWRTRDRQLVKRLSRRHVPAQCPAMRSPMARMSASATGAS